MSCHLSYICHGNLYWRTYVLTRGCTWLHGLPLWALFQLPLYMLINYLTPNDTIWHKDLSIRKSTGILIMYIFYTCLANPTVIIMWGELWSAYAATAHFLNIALLPGVCLVTINVRLLREGTYHYFTVKGSMYWTPQLPVLYRKCLNPHVSLST